MSPSSIRNPLSVYFHSLRGCFSKVNKENILTAPAKLTSTCNDCWIDHSADHLNSRIWKQFFKQTSKMQIFFFIYSYDQNGVLRIKELLCDLQALLHHGEPLAMPISIRAIHVVVVVLPVFRTGVIRRIDVDAVHLLCVQVFQQLERVVVVRLNQRMPKVAIWSVLNCIQRF